MPQSPSDEVLRSLLSSHPRGAQMADPTTPSAVSITMHGGTVHFHLHQDKLALDTLLNATQTPSASPA